MHQKYQRSEKTREQGKGIAVTGGILSTVGLCIQASVLFLALLGYTAVFIKSLNYLT